MVLKVIIPPWLSLGFYRGIKFYNYKYEKNLIEYEKEDNKKYIKPIYFYTTCFGSGFFGILVYANPFFLPITIIKEIYRVEVKIRNLNEEKEKQSFYELI